MSERLTTVYATGRPYEWHMFDELPPKKLARWHAGYLARCIATHEDER